MNIFNVKNFIYLLFTFSVSNTIAQQISVAKWEQIIPSKSIPSNIDCKKSNNNLDVVFYNEKYYLAFRTAPTHFASKKTRLFVMSSKDFITWEYETEFFVEADIREPRFSIFKDKLFLYFFEGGTKMFRFQPKYIWATELNDTGWSKKINTNLDGYVDWRFRTLGNTLYLSAYYGVDLYQNDHKANLRLFSSEDGFNFKPISIEPQVNERGAEEGEFIFDKEGNLWATVRLEGSGSLLCFAHKDSLDIWETKFSKYKYDSALLFEYKDDIYLIARNHLKGEATPVRNPSDKQRRKNLIRYSFSKKVTALYKIDKENMLVKHIMDFESTGDNAFPGIAIRNENSFYLLNYSSNINKREKIWIAGQLGKTFIYKTILEFK
jgi:hypothetical protein